MPPAECRRPGAITRVPPSESENERGVAVPPRIDHAPILAGLNPAPTLQGVRGSETNRLVELSIPPALKPAPSDRRVTRVGFPLVKRQGTAFGGCGQAPSDVFTDIKSAIWLNRSDEPQNGSTGNGPGSAAVTQMKHPDETVRPGPAGPGASAVSTVQVGQAARFRSRRSRPGRRHRRRCHRDRGL